MNIIGINVNAFFACFCMFCHNQSQVCHLIYFSKIIFEINPYKPAQVSSKTLHC